MRAIFGGRGERWAMDLSSVPAESSQAGRRSLGIFIITFGLFWTGLPMAIMIAVAIQDMQAGRAQWELLLFLIFPLIGVGVLLFGVHLLLWRRIVAFDGATFTVTERGLRGKKQWRQPLSAYIGVVRRTREVETENGSYAIHTVDLMHADSDRKINLYTDTSGQDFRRIWEDYARRLNVPALEDVDGGVARRDAADLDKSVGELIGEGKVDIDYQTISRPAEGLVTGVEGDDVLITRTGPEIKWWWMLFMVLFPLIFVGVGFLAPDVPLMGRIMSGGGGLLFELLLVILVISDLTSRKRLRAGADGVQTCSVSSRGEGKGKHIGFDDIESVTIASQAGVAESWVAIASDRQTLKFGNGLPRPSLEFVMNTVLAKIAETQRRGARKAAAS